MIYSATITTPKNTPREVPLVTRIPLCVGVIHQFSAFFPAGAQGLHRFIVRRAIHQILPTNSSDFFSGEDEHIDNKEFIQIDDEPKDIEIHSWNLDDTYDHTVLVRLGVLRINVVAPWLLTWREKFAV
jgi:hypothetical protein